MLSNTIRRRFGTFKANRKPHEVLGIPSVGVVTLQLLNKKYSELIKIHHPDISKLPDATQRFQEIKQAYDILKATAIVDTDAANKDQSSWRQLDKEEIKKKFGLKTEEEYIYFKIFGQTYEEDPEAYFLIKNLEKKNEYIKEIEKYRSVVVDKDSFRPNQHPAYTTY